MPLPNFNRHGLLPEGIHTCTLGEVKAQFCWNPWRKELFEKLQEFLEDYPFITANRVGMWIDGSFVREKEEPDDIDVVLDIEKHSEEVAKKVVWTKAAYSREIWNNYRVDLWFQHPTLENNFVTFFQYLGEKGAAATNLNSRSKKGILRVDP